MLYELKGRHKVCFKAKIGLDGPSLYRPTCTRITASDASETEKCHPRLPLNIGIWTVVRRTQRNDDINRNNKFKNKITIISTEQTVAHHALQPSRGASVDVLKTRLLMKPLIIQFFAFVHPPYSHYFKTVYGHFGPKTLRTQDISALVPKCPRDTSALVPKCLRHFGTGISSAEVS